MSGDADEVQAEATAYLLRNADGADRLLAALARARHGEFESHDLIDD